MLQIVKLRVVWIWTPIFAAGLFLILSYSSNVQQNLTEQSALEEAERFTRALTEFRSLYTSEVVNRVERHGIEIAHDYLEREASIPLPATLSMLLGERMGQASGAEFRLYSDFPFPWRKGGPRDEFEREALQALRRNPGVPFFRFERGPEGTLRYATADLMRQSCVNCHNTHPDSPKVDWKVGDVRGVLEVSLPMGAVVKQRTNDLRGLTLLIILLGTVTLVSFGFFIHGTQRSEAELRRDQGVLSRAHEELGVVVDEQTDQLRASEGRFRALFEGTNVAVVLRDPEDLKCIDCNRAALEMFGFDHREELIGTFVSHMTVRDEAEGFEDGVDQKLVARALKEGSQHLEWRYRRKDGTVFPADIVVTAIQTREGPILQIIITDMTEREQAKQAAKESKLRLEQVNRAKTTFLSSMSHELRTPLNGILGFADLLGGQHFGPLNDKQVHYVQKIDASGKLLLSLVSDIMDMIKIDAGVMDLTVEQISPSELIKAVVSGMEAEFNQKKLDVELNFDPSVEMICVDGGKFRKILLNLLSNAVKYTPEGGRIGIRTARLDSAQYRVEVSDTGAGIQPEDQQKIFLKFQDTGRDEALGGPGIGLALTHRLVELHGGEIGVESEVGKGSTFWFQLPLNAVGDEEQTEKGQATTGEGKRMHSGRRILVVEDNDVNLALILDLLSLHEFEVMVARNGQEAVDLARTYQPDLILMDIKMPVMGGLEATQQIRATAGFEDLPIIALTASVGDVDQETQFAAGCTAHLSKPLNSTLLFETIEKLLK